MNTESFELELNTGETVKVELPSKLPAVTGMEVRDKIKIGFEGDAQTGGNLQVENAQSVLNDAQTHLASELLEHHTDYSIDDVTLEAVDTIWQYYASQVNGKKKVSSDPG